MEISNTQYVHVDAHLGMLAKLDFSLSPTF